MKRLCATLRIAHRKNKLTYLKQNYLCNSTKNYIFHTYKQPRATNPSSFKGSISKALLRHLKASLFLPS